VNVVAQVQKAGNLAEDEGLGDSGKTMQQEGNSHEIV
jgi:hypothetical protein